MSFSRCDVVWVNFPRIASHQQPKQRYAIVLSADEYNDNNDHGVFVAISSTVTDESLPGVYKIKDRKTAGLSEASAVVPWLWTLDWETVIRKEGEVTPYELRQSMERLKQVIPL